MKVINKLTIKYLLKNKKIMISTIIGITLTSCLLFTIGLGAATIRQNNIERAINDYGNHDVEFYSLSYSNIKKLKENNNIANIIMEQVLESFNYEIDSDVYSANIVTMNVSYSDYITLIDGNMPSNENEVIIPTVLAKKYKISDYINDYKVVGIYNKSMLHPFDSNDVRLSQTNYIYTLKNIDEKMNVNFYITYKSKSNIFNKIYKNADSLELKYELNKDNVKIYNNTKINYNLLSSYGKYESKNTNLYIYLSLVFVLMIVSIVSIFVIYNSFAISFEERKKYFGILKSIGASSKQIFKSVFFEAFILCLISIPIGFILSFGITQIIILEVNKILENSSIYTLAIYPLFTIIALLFIIMTVFLSVKFLIYLMQDIEPIELIRMNDEIDNCKFKENKLVKKIFKIEGDIAYKNIKRNKSKYKTAINSLCISIVLFITFSTYINYALYYDSSYYDHDFDIEIQLPESSKKIIDDISNMDYIDNIVKYESLYVGFKANNYNDESNNNLLNYIVIYGLDEDSYEKFKNKINLQDDSAIILYNLARKYESNNSSYNDKYTEYEVFKDGNIDLNLCTDDNCYLNFSNFYLTNMKFLTSTQLGLSLIVNMSKFNEIKELQNKYNTDYQSNDYYMDIGIDSSNYQKLDTTIKQIIDNNPNINIHYQNNKLSYHNDYVSLMATKFLLYSIVLFITLIGITSVFNTINTSINLREREFSMFRSVGLSNKGFNKMIRLESIFLGIKTLLYGIPLSLLIITIIVLLDYLGTKKLTILFPTKYFIICSIGIILIIFLAMLYSSNKIKNKNIIESIRNENV